MSFVKMPQDDYVAMCNKLRSMLNETDKYTSKDFIEKMDELILPNLDEMDFGSNSSLPEKGNSNPQYYEDIAKAINEIKQADAVVLEELNVTESKKYTAPSGIAYSSVNVDIEEGGNPNYVETIEGTLFSPFGNHTRDELLSGIGAGEITAMLTVSLGGKEYTMPGQRVAKNLSFSRLVRADSGTGGSTFLTAVSITYDLRGLNTNTSNYHDSSGSWRIIGREAAKEISCTLTIIHHPLPDSGT